MLLSKGAVASVESKDTDGDAVQPVIYKSDWVDLIILTVPPEMMLGAASNVVGLHGTVPITDVTPKNDSSDSLEPVLHLLVKLFTWSPRFQLSLNGPFLIARNVQQEFMGIYSVTVVVSQLLTQVIRWNEAVQWPLFSVFYSCRQPLHECNSPRLVP